jgi:hypothetical protein
MKIYRGGIDISTRTDIVHRCLSSILVILIFLFLSLITTQQYFAVAQKDSFFKIEITFVEGQNRNVSDARVYIQEYPQYGIPGGTDSGFIDLNDAFYNDDPYTGIWKDEIVIPPDVMKIGEEFHACIEDTNKGITLACYKLENTEKQAPEKLTIDFNNFP